MSQACRSLADIGEIEHYAAGLAHFLAGQMDAERFTALRLQMGIYGQRQAGVNMVRVKLPAGNFSRQQLNAIGNALEQYSQQRHVHVTTRQDIQMHFVPLEKTPAVLHTLAAEGLTTREACGNTLRNMTGCAFAGVCVAEHTDVNTHINAAVNHFLRNPLNQQLPRKMKFSFSGCEQDCAQGMIHDVAVIARYQDGQPGFRILAGGGLGHKPREAIEVVAWLPEVALIPCIEALISLHNRYSDRTKRAKSRIKFLVERFGATGFIEKFQEEFARTRAALAVESAVQGVWRTGAPVVVNGSGAPRHVQVQRQSQWRMVPVSLGNGDLSLSALRALVTVLQTFGLDHLRATQDQNLVILNVPAEQVDALVAALAAEGLSLPVAGDNVVACPGTSTCRLGITGSMAVAPKLAAQNIAFAVEHGVDLRVRVSGCHNGCAQPETGDIGIYGEGKRLHGKLVPHYQLYLGGDGRAGFGVAKKAPSVPVARVEAAIARLQAAFVATREPQESFFVWSRRQAPDFFSTLLAEFTQVSAEDLASVLRDHGAEGDFRVLQLGGGECAGLTQMKVSGNFYEAAHEKNYRDAFLHQRKPNEALEAARAMVKLLGDGVLSLYHPVQPDNLAATQAAFAVHVPALADPLKAEFGDLVQAVMAAEVASLSELPLVFTKIDAFMQAAAQFCLQQDPHLDLTGAL